MGRWDEGSGTRDDGTKKPMSNVLNMVFVERDDGTKEDGT